MPPFARTSAFRDFPRRCQWRVLARVPNSRDGKCTPPPSPSFPFPARARSGGNDRSRRCRHTLGANKRSRSAHLHRRRRVVDVCARPHERDESQDSPTPAHLCPLPSRAEASTPRLKGIPDQTDGWKLDDGGFNPPLRDLKFTGFGGLNPPLILISAEIAATLRPSPSTPTPRVCTCEGRPRLKVQFSFLRVFPRLARLSLPGQRER